MKAFVLLLCLVSAGCSGSQHDALPGFPRIMLWAWERPEDLRFIDPAKIGVAYLAGTVTIGENRVDWRPRMQPLRIPPRARLMAVVRVESGGASGRNVSQVAELIAGAGRNTGVSALQIDYDARYGERPFYRELVKKVRTGMPNSMPLTITALVSWCASDTWISNLPVNAAVPMFFRMGSEKLMRQAKLRSPLCADSTGISTDELEPVKLAHRVFLFNPTPWTEGNLQAVLHEVNRWR